MVIGFLFKEDLLWLFGASENTIGYANDYMSIYLFGTLFVLIGLGMNSFINSQGFAKNWGCDGYAWSSYKYYFWILSLFFGLSLGVKGAAIATVFFAVCFGCLDISFSNWG